MEQDFINKIRKGQINLNKQENLISIIIKSFLYNMNNEITLRGVKIPHIIINSGDDILYLENKGYDFSKEPLDNTNENYIINKIPRAVVTVGGVNLLPDQLTNPYTTGELEMEHNDLIYSLSAEFRRMPMTINVTVKYYLDSYLDALEVVQQLVARFGYIWTFKSIYMGKTITSSIQIPDSITAEKTIEFDGGTTDSKCKTIEVSYDIETNMPIYNNQTVISNDKRIQKEKFEIKEHKPTRINKTKHELKKL